MRPSFSSGAKVFVKVRGYPPWPARIEGCADETPNKMKYHVYFYGTGETAVVKTQDVFDFVDNRNKFGKLKKNKNFTEAMLQIEAELLPEQKAAIAAMDALPSNPVRVSSASDSDAAPDTPKEKITTESPEPTTHSNRRSSTSVKVNKITPNVPSKASARDNKRKLDSDSLSDHPSSKKPNTTVKPLSPSQPEKEIKSTEGHSRSGRKIKPKKFIDFEKDGTEESKEISVVNDREDDSKPVVKDDKKQKIKDDDKKIKLKEEDAKSKEEEKKLKLEVKKEQPHESEKKLKEGKRNTPKPKSFKEPEESNDAGPGDWYLLATRGKEQIKIPIKLNRPNFEDNKKRSMTVSRWENLVFEEARALKKRFESGEEFTEAEITDHMDRFTRVKASSVSVYRSPEEEEQFRKQTYDVESALLDIEVNIRNSLCLKRAKTKDCLQHLESLKNLSVTALMLKKHPQIVKTIRKLRKYVGNVSSWRMTEDEIQEFNADAEKIRAMAEIIINSFKTLFFQPKSVSFWEHFYNELAAFNAKTRHMSLEDVFSIITEPE